MKRPREVFYIGLFDSLPILRDPMLMIVISLFSFLPVLFAYIFAPQPQLAMQTIVGAIVLSLGFIGLFIAQSVYFYKYWHRFQDMFVASPVSPLSYAMGLAFSTLLGAAPATVVAFILLYLQVPYSVLALLQVLAVTVLFWLSMVFIGYTIGAVTKNTRRANSLPQVLGIVLGFLPPVYYTLDTLPPFLQPIALLIPSTNAAQLAKYYFGLISISTFEIVFGWVYLIAFVIGMGLVAVRRAHWVDP